MIWGKAFEYLILLMGLGTSLSSSMQCGYNTSSLTGDIAYNSIRGSSFECVWTITAPRGYQISLVAKTFYLRGSCDRDYVAVESPYGTHNVLQHGTFCGTSFSPKIVSKENILRIRYVYNGYNYYPSGTSTFSLYHKAERQTTLADITEEWIKNNLQIFLDNKETLPRIIASMFLLNETYFTDANISTTNLMNQYRLKLSEDLVRNSTHPLTTAALSHHVTAMLAICSNPRSFYGVDLVSHLRHLVNKKKGLVNPYYLLTLCNAGDKITSADVKNLKYIIALHKKDVFWLDFQALATMALVCARQQHETHDVSKELEHVTSAFKNHQLKNGSFGSIQTTALVIQALAAAKANESRWNKMAAIEFVEKANYSDGSFGNFYDLYAAIPVIASKTLLDINASNCDFTPGGLIPIDEIEDKLAEPIHVMYSLWIGDNVDFSYTVTLQVPNGTKFFDFMRLAAQTDKKFEFRWTNVSNVLYVYEIHGLVNDPSSGKYWTFLTGPDLFNLRPYKGLEHYVPTDGDIAVMWYKTIAMEHPWKEIDKK